MSRLEMSRDARLLWRGFCFALGVYVVGHIVLWATWYRPNVPHRLWPIAAPVIVLMNLAFIVVAGLLAIRVEKDGVLRSALVSSAAVGAGSVIRTALAAMGMREFLMWDHDSVVISALTENLYFAVLCFVPAFLIAAVSRHVHRRWGRLFRVRSHPDS